MLRCLCCSIIIFFIGCGNRESIVNISSAKWIDKYELSNRNNNENSLNDSAVIKDTENFIVSTSIDNKDVICREVEDWAKKNLKKDGFKDFRFFYDNDEITLKNKFFYNDFDYLITDNILCAMDGSLKCYSCNARVVD